MRRLASTVSWAPIFNSCRLAASSFERPVDRPNVDDDDDDSEYVSEALLRGGSAEKTTTTGTSSTTEPSGAFPLASEQEELLSLMNDIAVNNKGTSRLSMAHPSITGRTFGIALPPKWAAEVPRRLARSRCMQIRSSPATANGLHTAPLDHLSSKKVYLYQQAFIHPSYVRVERPKLSESSKKGDRDPNTVPNVALRFTNYPLTILGHSLLRTALLHWAVGVAPTADSRLLNEVIGVGSAGKHPLLTDDALARIASIHWSLDDLLLGDGKMYEKAIERQRRSAASGGPSPASLSSSSHIQRPVSHTATVVPSLCAAVYLSRGMDVGLSFIEREVIPLLTKDARQILAIELEDESARN